MNGLNPLALRPNTLPFVTKIILQCYPVIVKRLLSVEGNAHKTIFHRNVNAAQDGLKCLHNMQNFKAPKLLKVD